jgi:hypothetical protein
MEREKRTTSGPLLEVDFFPVWEDGRRKPSRDPKKKVSPAAKKKYNDLQMRKKAIRDINANFDNQDIFMSPTYEQSKAPQSYEEVLRDTDNYIRKVKRKRASELKRIIKLISSDTNNEKLKKIKKKLEAPFKYYYSVEEVTYKTGRYAGRSNWHIHMFMTGGISRDELEEMWPSGIRVNADRFQPEKFGPEAAARYITKDAKGRRRIKHSRNLINPEIKQKDGFITSRGVELLAKRRVDDKEYWEKRYKGYKFVRCYARYNEYNGNWYVSVIMYRNDRAVIPDWKISEWIND